MSSSTAQPLAPNQALFSEGLLVAERYRLVSRLGIRGTVERWLAEDTASPSQPTQIILVLERTPPPSVAQKQADESSDSKLDFNLPPANDDDQPTAELSPPPTGGMRWPGIGWEKNILSKTALLSLPRILDSFTLDGISGLVEEYPVGIELNQAWYATGTDWTERCEWLIQIADLLRRLHRAGAVLERLKPSDVIVTATGQAVLLDVGLLLPLGSAIDRSLLRPDFSTAPEWTLDRPSVDARCDLYCFGAMVTALLLGRDLTQHDFDLMGNPRSFLDQFPDINPFLGRLLARTFVRNPDARFPTQEGREHDETGMTELSQALEGCRRNLGRVHHEIACWSTTGIYRAGNEDAVAILHGADARLEDTDQYSLILLADGMGGMEGGEIAAAMCIQSLRQQLLEQPPFSGLRSSATPAARTTQNERIVQLANELSSTAQTVLLNPTKLPAESLMVRPTDRDSTARSNAIHSERLIEVLKEANRVIYEASRHGLGGRGMGCTAEIVLIDGRNVIVAHVGDSRVYHFRDNTLTQVTKDQTFVARMVELGHLTPEEAERHPRRAELQQAIGGRVEVLPDTMVFTLEPGDWILACSDGLNLLPHDVIESILRDAPNAERAARRLVNLANVEGANDNVTVAVVRAL
ncbi:MAG: protein phosphatase 2C domain-containing protein [Gemmataceae bacterium]|jgi:serine/threonine protein phosphatase PrpC|nr:protein phosphatase 2C domain-containing protein [Gemmataceae bacterium]